MNNAILAVHINEANPNHHLWLNNGIWWMHYTLHLRDYTKMRVRCSLGTKCVVEARRKRDEMFRQLGECGRASECEQVVLLAA